MSQYPSIFNDVIGPIMRGPSSSHCAASVRIGRLARDLMDGRIERVLIEFDPNGSLATTHDSQGSDMGLFGGLLGWEAQDARLVDSAKAIRDAGIAIDIRITDIASDHPNTYQLTLTNGDEQHTLRADSIGGGMIRVTRIDEVPLTSAGDYFQTLIYTIADAENIERTLREKFDADAIEIGNGRACAIVQVQAQKFVDDTLLDELRQQYDVQATKKLAPVLPVLSRKDLAVPFITCADMLAGGDAGLDELAIQYETARSGMTDQQVVDRMIEIVRLLRDSIQQGIAGTDFDDRILGYQCGKYQQRMGTDQMLDGGVMDRMVLYVSALMEVKSAMGVIVAAPTAGSCGTLPGTLLAAADARGADDERTARAMLAAGMIGVFIAAHSSFAAEVGGCQAETGSGAAMAAAALVVLVGGSTRQSVGAASMALQNSLGMICDPVANRVEAPCLGKNVMGAVNALACCNMALADYNALIPLDEVIDTHFQVGNTIPASLRCTARGGLSTTPTSLRIEAQLKARK